MRNTKRGRFKKNKVVSFIPIGIRDEIVKSVNENHSKRNKQEKIRQLYGDMDYLLSKWLREDKSWFEPLEISWKNLRGNICANYKDRLKLLSNIISTNGKYFNGGANRFCKNYNLNTDLSYTELVPVWYYSDYNEKVGTSRIEKKTANIIKRLTLSINDEEITEIIKNECLPSTILKDRLKVNYDIPDKVYQLGNNGAQLSRDKIISIAEQEGKDVILYKNKVYIKKLDSFLIKKSAEIRHSLTNSFSRVKNLVSLSKRNDTNRRLDTLITNLPYVVFKHLLLDGERLVSIDLTNSQFLFLGRLIKLCYDKLDGDSKEFDKVSGISPIYKRAFKLATQSSIIDGELPSDILQFIEEVSNGTFYEKFVEKSIPNHKELSTEEYERERWNHKLITMRVFFSHYRFNGADKTTFKKAYPNLIWLIDAFKKNVELALKGIDKHKLKRETRKSLPVLLQCCESALFIDKILNKLLRLNREVLSKHDSIICKESEVGEILLIVNYYLNQYFNEYTIKVE